MPPVLTKSNGLFWRYSGLQSHEVSQRCAGTLKSAATQTKPKGCTSLISCPVASVLYAGGAGLTIYLVVRLNYW
jgi:hypothetical protein